MIKLRFAKHIYASFMLLLLCSSIISLAGIKGFQGIAPAINDINNRNTRSLYYAEQMLTSISSLKDIRQFEIYLDKSKQNITEKDEKETIDNIEKNYKLAFSENKIAERNTIDAIINLTKINRTAMLEAGKRAERLENVGIWIIIFPTIFAWIIGITLLKLLEKIFIKPLTELREVISDYKKGNKMRRCPKTAKSKEFQELYNDINTIFDNL